MSKTETIVANQGVSTMGILGCLFVGLKLGGIIDWSWWWVTAPFWGPLALVVLFVLVVAVIVAITNRV